MSEGSRAVPRCRVGHIHFRGWRAIELDNGLVGAVAVPDIGGRIMAFDLGFHSFLWTDPRLAGKLFTAEENQGDGSLASWKNYGGDKTWPAPQGWDTDEQWHGPPDPVLDSGRYTVERVESTAEAATVRLRSPEDPRTGIQLVRELTLHQGRSHATLHLEMRNVSGRERTWSIWDVLQLDATCRTGDGRETHNDQAWLYIPIDPASRFSRGYQVTYGDKDNPQWRTDVSPNLLAVQYQYRLGKVVVDSSAGWLAFVDRTTDFAFCERFTYYAGMPYPDGGASVECWTTGIGEPVGGLDYRRERIYHLEAEVLGPLRTLAPGEAQALDIEWHAARCPGPIVDVTAAGCSHQRLSAEDVSAGVRLTGVFGVFAWGEAQLVWRGATGQELGVESIGPADPLGVLAVDLVRRVPTGAAAVELRVADTQGQLVGELDRVGLGAPGD
ncbi:MAG: DUF4380 domain-containing protein [Chloroflexi bacterium]|nr:DUF4380 domain-containing protein [Chloroflexota bacterium]